MATENDFLDAAEDPEAKLDDHSIPTQENSP